MGSRIACVGDRTTTGAIFVKGSSAWLVNGKALILDGDTILCPVCKATGGVVATGGAFVMLGRKAALDGDMVACVCPPGANRVIASGAPTWHA